jgi:hypothetical protein
MFRLQRRAVAFTRIRDRGGEVPDARSEHRPPPPFYPSCGLPRHIFKSLRYLRPAPKGLRRQPRGCVMRISPSRRPRKHTGRVPTEMKEYPARK